MLEHPMAQTISPISPVTAPAYAAVALRPGCTARPELLRAKKETDMNIRNMHTRGGAVITLRRDTKTFMWSVEGRSDIKPHRNIRALRQRMHAFGIIGKRKSGGAL